MAIEHNGQLQGRYRSVSDDRGCERVQEEVSGLRAEVGVLAAQLRDAQNHIATRVRSSAGHSFLSQSVM